MLTDLFNYFVVCRILSKVLITVSYANSLLLLSL